MDDLRDFLHVRTTCHQSLQNGSSKRKGKSTRTLEKVICEQEHMLIFFSSAIKTKIPSNYSKIQKRYVTTYP